MKNNVRHISIYSEFNSSSTINLVNGDFEIQKDLNVISLNSSKNYIIKNLNINTITGKIQLEDCRLNKLNTSLRFFLDDNPLQNEYNRLKLNVSDVILLNGLIPSLPITQEPTSLDILDSSNINHENSKYVNTFKFSGSRPLPARLDLKVCKTQTVSEFGFTTISAINGIDTTFSPNINYYETFLTNNSIKDFNFFSHTFKYLCMSIYPEFSLSGTNGALLQCYISFVINFDLEELI